uniref:Uncharacterized protein n=1 Tax=Melanopsichium pennsylvanicum 4 TaxID=1398559 RepID=A0A077RBY5_9BASI|nr:conserved hypothetical protein [Melanopsichium pennsylvanicum 4]
METSAEAHKPHPHPEAPPQIAQQFDHFQKVFSSGPHFHPEKLNQTSSSYSSSSSLSSQQGSGLLGNVDMKGREAAEDTHLLPDRFWRTSALQWDEAELDAVMTGGAN